MIERVELYRFQQFKKKVVDFDEFITCLVGETGSGKSTIIRLLQWIAFNRPSGTEMVQHGRDRCRGVLHIDGRTVERIRGVRSNLYRLDGEAFKAFGQTVPEQIAKLLNVSEVNFQAQLDSPFWLADPASKVSRELNAVVNLSVIDETLSNSASRLRTSKAEMDVCESRLTKARQERDNLSGWVPDFVAAVKWCEELNKRIVRNRNRIAQIASKLDQATQLRLQAQRSSCAKGEALALKSLGERYFAGLERVERLRGLIGSGRRWSKRSQQAIPTLPVMLAEKIDKASKRIERLEWLIATYKTEDKQLCLATKSATEAEAELAKAGNQCPVCGGPLRLA